MKKKKKNKIPFKIIILIIAIVLVSYAGFTLARYVIEELHGYYLNSKHSKIYFY